MGTHRYAISIAASPEVVYDLYADPRRHPEWESGSPTPSNFSSTTIQPGTTYDVNYGRLTYHIMVEAADRPHAFEISASGPLGLRATSRGEFVPEDGGTSATMIADIQSPIPLLGRLIELVILPPRVVRQELARFKAIAERESGRDVS